MFDIGLVSFFLISVVMGDTIVNAYFFICLLNKTNSERKYTLNISNIVYNTSTIPINVINVPQSFHCYLIILFGDFLVDCMNVIWLVIYLMIRGLAEALNRGVGPLL